MKKKSKPKTSGKYTLVLFKFALICGSLRFGLCSTNFKISHTVNNIYQEMVREGLHGNVSKI